MGCKSIVMSVKKQARPETSRLARYSAAGVTFDSSSAGHCTDVQFGAMHVVPGTIQTLSAHFPSWVQDERPRLQTAHAEHASDAVSTALRCAWMPDFLPSISDNATSAVLSPFPLNWQAYYVRVYADAAHHMLQKCISVRTEGTHSANVSNRCLSCTWNSSTSTSALSLSLDWS